MMRDKSVKKRLRKHEKSLEQKFREEQEHCYRVLSDYLHLLKKWKIEYAPKNMEDEWNPLFCEALHNIDRIEYLLDILLQGDVRDRAFLVENQGRKVRKIEERIREANRDKKELLQAALEENHVPLTVEEVKEMLLRTEKGAVKGTIGNCLIVFQNDPYLTGALAYNMLAVKINIMKTLWYERTEGEAMNDTDLAYIRLYMENCYGLTSRKNIEVAARLAAHGNSFHPVQDYLNQLSWDGTERIRYCLHHFLGSDVDDFNYEVC